MSVFDLDTEGQRSVAQEAAANAAPFEPHPGFLHGIPTGVGAGVMRGGARAAQLVGMAGGGLLSLYERGTGLKEGSLTDPYFRAVDEYANNAVDYWTPQAEEVGTAGRVLGGLSEIVLPLMAGGGNPALMIGSQEMGGATDLARQGVSAGPAVGVGVIQGLATGVGFKIPFIGKTLASRMASGAAGNLAVNAGSSAASSGVLKATGNEDAAQQFNPLDPEARIVDVLTGLAFGGLAHHGARSDSHIQREFIGRTARELTPTEVAAAATVANAKHFQEDTAPGQPKDLAASIAHQDAMESATRELLEGEPVVAPEEVMRADFEPRDREASAEARLAAAHEEGTAQIADAARDEYVASQTAESVPGYTVDEGGTHVTEEAFQGLRSDVQTHEDLGGHSDGIPGRQGRADDGGTGEVANQSGEPLTVYRGGRGGPLTPQHFERESLGKATGHPSSGLGVYFTNDPDDAARYGTVTAHHLDIRNPKIFGPGELPGFDTMAEATAFRQELRQQGHDGITLDYSSVGGPVQHVAFEPHQAIPAQAAKPTVQATARPAPPRVAKGEPDQTRDSAIEYIAKSGGVNIDEAKSEGFDPADMKAQRVGIRHAFHRKGMTIESAGEALAQAGYPVTDATGAVDKNLVLDLMARELAGRKQYSVDRSPAEFERELAQHTADREATRAQLHEDMSDNPDWSEQSAETRTFTELANEARRHATSDEVDAALEANDDIEARRRLEALIARGEPTRETDRVAEGARPGATESGVARQAPGEQDLFGQDTRSAQALADETRRRDLARNSGQESLETGRPGDLFSQARHQVDIADALADRPDLEIPDAMAKQAENDWFTATTAAEPAPTQAPKAAPEARARAEAKPAESAAAKTPDITAAEQAVAEADFRIPTGEIDADGNPVSRSAREFLAEADAGLARAQQDGKGIMAAVTCFLQRGA